MSRSRFKEALNELSSPERTALLYLESLILKTKQAIPQPVDLAPIHNKLKEMDDTVEAVELIVHVFKEDLKTIAAVSEKMDKYAKELKKFDAVTKEVIKQTLKKYEATDELTREILDRILDLEKTGYSLDFIREMLRKRESKEVPRT